MDQNGEHELQDRVRMTYGHIGTMLEMRRAAQGRSLKAKAGSNAARKANEAQAEALWWGACALRAELVDDIRDGAKQGLLPVLWSRDERADGRWFWGA